MFEALTTDILLTGGIIAASALAFAGGMSLLRAPSPAPSRVDLDEAVRKAPYHRLHNVLPMRKA